MELKKFLDEMIGKKHGYCECCHKMAELTRVKVRSFAGMPSFKYLCSTCETIERLKKY